MTKGKTSKRFVAFATIMMVLAAMMMPATAAPGNPEGQITVHKLAGNAPGAINNHTGERLSSLPAGYTPLGGAEFTLYTVNAADIATVNAAITADNKLVGHSIDASGAAPVVTFNLFNSTTSTPSTLTATASVVYGVETTATGTGQAVFGPNIPDGYYVLVETDTPAGYDGAEASLIRLPLTYGVTATNPGTFNYDVHIYPKNVSNTDFVVKEMPAEQAPVTKDSIVPFELKAKFKNDAAAPNTVNSIADLRDGDGSVSDPYTYGTAKITESFSTYFELSGTISVYWLDSNGEIDTGAGALTDVTDYVIAPTSATATTGAIYEVSLTNAGIDKAILGNKVGFGLVLNGKYIGTPTGTQGSPTTLTNTMTALMNPATGNGGGGGTSTTHIPSISIKVNKTDQVTNAVLPGVTFAVAKVATPAMNYVPGTPASAFSAPELTALAANYVVDATGVPITAVTDASGNVAFSHLEGYTDAAGATYYLKELATASGYQLKINTIQVTFNTKAGYIADTATPATWFDAADKWTALAQVVESVDITNAPLGTQDGDEPGFSLPLTGGAGTVAFTAIGIIVMLGAAVVYLHGKKRTV